jgi:hypothetical protein
VTCAGGKGVCPDHNPTEVLPFAPYLENRKTGEVLPVPWLCPFITYFTASALPRQFANCENRLECSII